MRCAILKISSMWSSGTSHRKVATTPNVGNSFTKSCNNWRDGTYENFTEWAVRQFGKKDLDLGEDIPVEMQKSKDIVFKKNE